MINELSNSGISSSIDGYAAGAQSSPDDSAIEFFPFSAPFTASTNAGSLLTTNSRAGPNGMQS